MPERLRYKIRWSVLLLAGLISLGLSFCWGPLFFPRPDQKSEAERIFRVFEEKEKTLRSEMDKFASQLSSGGQAKDLWLKSDWQYPESAGLYYTISAHDSLIFWSSSLVSFENKPMQIREEGDLKKMPTGWFYIFQRKAGSYIISGYMLIKRNFPYQNRYIRRSRRRFLPYRKIATAIMMIPTKIIIFSLLRLLPIGSYLRMCSSLLAAVRLVWG